MPESSTVSLVDCTEVSATKRTVTFSRQTVKREPLLLAHQMNSRDAAAVYIFTGGEFTDSGENFCQDGLQHAPAERSAARNFRAARNAKARASGANFCS
jgi:hypothetical protein